jgi:farnesyl-diphosphate farnesyltransferase
MTKGTPAQPLAKDLEELLRGVSRSFFLSIRLLPATLRAPIGLAYLLARATDTVADTAAVPVEERQAHLQLLSGAVQSLDPLGLDGLGAEFAPQQEDEFERRLILTLPRLIALLDAQGWQDRAEIQAVLRHITRGQSLDLERFGTPGAARALATARDLEEYTYLVAGCVGEFWTELGLRHLPRFAEGATPDEMRAWGRQYGSALQLVNILRDAGDDLASGRCYFPQDQLAQFGLSPTEVARDPQLLLPVWLQWHAAANERLASGLRYAAAVRGLRVRAASALPALLGARTLALLADAGPAALTRKIKVPRAEVRAIAARLLLTLAARAPMQAQFARLRPGGWDNRAR